MAKSYEELLNQANEVSNETQYGANTAPRVGGLNADIIEKIKEVEGKIAGHGAEIITSTSDTVPKDDNIFSALAAINKFLRKDKEDSTYNLLRLVAGAVFGREAARIDEKGIATFLKVVLGANAASIDASGILTAVKALLQNIVLSGDLKSDNFLAGALGTGYALIKRDADGKSYFEVDKLFARVKAIFAVLEIMKVTYTGGNFVFSPAGMNCTKVEEFEEYYRCFFTADDGEKAVENTFEVDDLVQLREFNVKSGVYENVSNRYFWRRCIAKGDDYIDLSKTDRDMTSDDAPMAGDALVTIGNKTIASRQNVIIISVYGEGSPSIIQYEGINDYTLDGKAKTVISPNGNKFTGSFTFESGKDIEDELGDLNDKIDKVELKSVLAEYSSNKIDWHPSFVEGDVWMRTSSDNGTTWTESIRIVGERGPQGIPGQAGADGKVYYTWIRYADNAQGGGISNDPTGKKYIGFAYNKESQTESNNPSDYTWSLIKGDKGEQGVPGAKGADGKTYYTWIKYSDNSDGSGMYDVPTSSTLYIGIAVNKTTQQEGSNPEDYTWSRFKGEQGERGLQGLQGEQGKQGIPGKDGVDGKTTYFHIKYSSVSNPTSSSQITETPDTYIGTYVDFTKDDSTDPSKYTWARFEGIQGEKGDQGIPGKNGANGQTSYLHIAYANSEDGSKDFSVSDSTNKQYIGQYTDFTQADSTDYKKYSWSKIKGNDGSYVVVQFAKNTSLTVAPTTGWSSTPPASQSGYYIWMRMGTVVPPAKEPSVWGLAIRQTGDAGIDGKNVYRLDLTNEVAGVSATSDGTVSGTLPSTDMNVYDGKTLDSGWAFAATYQGCTGSISGNTLTIKTLTADTASATVTATKSGKPTLTAVMSIYKVKAGADGSDGKDAVIYSIVPSATQVIKSSTGTLTPASLTCAKYKTIGNGSATVTTEKTLKYQRLGVDSAEVAYSGTIAVTAETKSVVFSLYDGSTLLDRENVPVLSDASDLVVGIRNLAIYNTCLLENMTKNGYELTQKLADTRDFFQLMILSYDKNNAIKMLVNKTISAIGIYSFVVSSDIIPNRIRIKTNGATRDTGVYFYNSFKANTQYTITLEITNITQGSFSWKNVMITEGNKQVDFTPAPEDIDQQIEDTLNSSKTYTDSKIEATEEKITLEVNKVQINTRNLVKNGEFKISGSTSYLVKNVELYVPLVVGQKYTVVSKATVRGNQLYRLWASNNISIVSTLQRDDKTGLYMSTFTYNPVDSAPNRSLLFIYNYPSSTAAANPMDIEWFCLYEGEVRVPRDFNPAFEDATEYTNSKIEQTSEEITSTVSKWVQGGNNLITNTYQEFKANGTSTSTSANYLTNNWVISPKCAGKSIVTIFKVRLRGCTLTSSSKIYIQATNIGGWNYNTLCSRTITYNGEFLVTGMITAPSTLTDKCSIRIRFDYIKGGTITIRELRSYVADSIEPFLPWEPSEGDLVGFDSKIQQTADSISLKVQELVTGEGGNILYNSSFNTTTDGWGNAGDITYVGGGYGTKVLNPYKYLNQNVSNRMLDKSVGTVYTISFDIYKPSTLKVLNVRLQANGTANDTNPIDLSDVPAYTWTRVVTHQTIKAESECELLVFGNSTTGDYTDSTGMYYVRYVQLEIGDTATAWKESQGGLLATGIDIQNKKLIFTANNTVIQDNSGKQIAMFTVKDGKPLLAAENIDVENLSVKKLETSNQVYDELSYKMVIDAETSTFAMKVKDSSGEQAAVDLAFGTDDYGQTIADMLFNKFSGQTLLGRTQINRELMAIETYLNTKLRRQFKATSEYIMVKQFSEYNPTLEHQDSIKIGPNFITMDNYSKGKTYNAETKSILVNTAGGSTYFNFYMGIFVGTSSQPYFAT